jgi:hypothetical protein
VEVAVGLLDQAVQNHTMWRIKLLAAMNGGPQIENQVCRSETQCELGKWLEGESAAALRAPEKVASLKKSHAQFHRCIGEVALQVERQEWTDARQSIFHGQFHQGMLDLIRAIDVLKAAQGPEKTKRLSWAKAPPDWEPKASRKTHAPIKAHWA